MILREIVVKLRGKLYCGATQTRESATPRSGEKPAGSVWEEAVWQRMPF